MTTVGVDWLLYFCVSSRTTANPESMLRSSNSTPRSARNVLTHPQGGQSCWVNTITLDWDMLFRQGRFAGRRTQNAVHGVRSSLLRFVEMPHLQFTQEPKCHQLHARHDQHRAKHHHRAVLVHNVHVADELLNHHPECNQQSGDRTDRAKAAKEVQRARHV